MELPWLAAVRLEDGLWEETRRRAIFECCKWDPQVGDVESLCPFAILLRPSAWRELTELAERLSREILVAEEELLDRPDLQGTLALPRAARRALLRVPAGDRDRPDVRVLRLDFHFTRDGWRVSEANTDVPGGYNEASGFSAIVARQVPGARTCGDPAEALVDAIARRLRPGATVALAHATGYSDDRQVMVYLSRLLESRGQRPVLVAPDHLVWRDGLAAIQTAWLSGAVDFIFRFFPAEWLPSLSRACGWTAFFRGSRTALCNPGSALLIQSKRWPLVWDRLRADSSAWRKLLPETRDPRDVRWRGDPEWVVKPALGRVGEMVGIHGVSSGKEWAAIEKSMRWGTRHWIAQRRFEAVPLETPGGARYPCFGVYTVDGKVAGAYGRLARRPLIDQEAQDAAVLVGAPQADTKFLSGGELVHGCARAV